MQQLPETWSTRTRAGEYAARRRRMAETGIGFAGVDGVWWRPARDPFTLPQAIAQELVEVGKAIFALFDVVQTLYSQDEEEALRKMLRFKVPAGVLSLASCLPALSVRPDFQLQPLAGGGYRPVVTELEMCPSAHGFAHAMQWGYGLKCDLVEDFLWLLEGRPLLFVGSVEWSEFLWEQLSFCQALTNAGGTGRVLFSRPLAEIAESVLRGQRWQPPIFGIKEKPPGWNIDVRGRLVASGLASYLWPNEHVWPESVGQAALFRFGYLENFSARQLDFFPQWIRQGATILNPVSYLMDSKVIMATLALPTVRAAISEANSRALSMLDRSIPPTLLLEAAVMERLADERSLWVLKYAGFDGDNRAWGGRSLVVGAQQTADQWRATLLEMAALPWPVIAQHLVPSLQQDIAYLDRRERVRWLREGRSRLRAFFLRRQGDVRVSGAHVTLARSGVKVSESSEAVQAPVSFV